MKKLFILSIFALSFSACKQDSKPSTQAINATAAPTSCIIGKWRNTLLPLDIRMSSEFSGDYTNADLVATLNPLEQMAKVWNTAASPKALVTTPFAIAADTGFAATTNFRDSEIGIYKSYTWFPNVSSSALAITQFYGVVTSSLALGQYIELTHADIIVNYRDYGSKLTMVNNPLVEFDLPTVILHEMGHLLGLCHEINKPSVMAPYYLTTQRSLQTADSELIKKIYVGGTGALQVKNNNANALSARPGTEVTGVIELHADGKCIHHINGRKAFEHIVEINKKSK